MDAIVIIGITAVKFPLGQIVITSNANAQLDPAAVSEALRRHAAGDWGDICPDDAEANADALKEGDRLMSVYGPKDRQFLDHHRVGPLGDDDPAARRLLTRNLERNPPWQTTTTRPPYRPLFPPRCSAKMNSSR